MPWSWQIKGWPDFRYNASTVAPLEERLLLSSGEILGAVHHVCPSERDQLRIDLLSDEAVTLVDCEDLRDGLLRGRCVVRSERQEVDVSGEPNPLIDDYST